MMNQAPIYARVEKRRPNLGLMLGIPLAVLATGAIVLMTSQPKNDLLVDGPAVPAASTPATTPVVRAPTGVTPAAAPTPRATPAPVQRTASAAPRRPAPAAADVTEAAQDAGAIVAPMPAPVTVAPADPAPAPVVEAPVETAPTLSAGDPIAPATPPPIVTPVQ